MVQFVLDSSDVAGRIAGGEDRVGVSPFELFGGQRRDYAHGAADALYRTSREKELLM
jgi:hypothetical protein